MESNIILVGMPASGKSTIGSMLADTLDGYTFYDTDSIIEKTEGISISEIFKKHSEDFFRKLEYDTIKLVCTGTRRVISVGGGAFENPDSRGRLLNFGKVIYLKSDLDVLYYRLSEDFTRPLLQADNPKEVLKNLLQKREANYQKAHFTIDTSNLSKEEIIKNILEFIDDTNN
ncbi:MAG: shikimate kinase [bacterium]|nr:shikimate kinase [bacterium]